ncbi:U3 small nucleolar ribonucleoprotein complex subunit Mpp10p [Penicillium argentinense]|uniref:U3 small nucleolar ribonucleoprotein protein MPP10 n=1 Tax=Penicillium argentinense TaxID=1131581 RepID=A0A9W9FFV8_9EURO|nr:U3 small nucleolar ribonucleoprotein complex subunit Mpp10p [Penicillium argentinense]KAJ5099217.1 U3 small nucleolar ribonucleoprotein complex subunit Mpp10p [Penicillium argentinense]
MVKRKKSSDAVSTVATATNNDLPSALSTPWTFLQPSADLHALLADSAKRILDPLATSVVDEQTIRKQLNRKRKRTEPESTAPPLQLKNLYVDGFTSNQVWEQATRILESAGGEIERDVALLSQYGGLASSDEELGSLEGSGPEDIGSESDGAESMSDAFSEEEEEEEEEEGEDLEDNGSDAELEAGSDIDDEELDDAEAIEEEKLSDEEGSDASEEEDVGTYTEDKFGLNDGFFSIDDFNKQTELLERQDMKGGADDDDDDEEEEVNWHADPFVAGDALPNAKKVDVGATGGDDDMEDDDSEEDGPTFGNADLNADSDDDDDAEPDVDPEATSYGDTSNVRYADFFAPPPRKASSKRSRALPKTQPAQNITDDDVNRAMADVRRDLFDDEEEVEEEDIEMGEDGEPQGPRSTHEKQRAKIADEIRRLEAANVAKKEWTMAGEARAVERPVNSLIEEDLDFERVGKPVPVVTNETSEDIEELVKRRILANEFDEVIRRRPGAGDNKAQRRARFELEDTKPQQSLAEMYETDHLRANDPNFVDTKDKKLAREHAEIQNLWKEVSSQLDTLCNWHYKPKTPQANINVVTDAPTIMMEDARPTVGSAAGGPSALAPQEVYAPGDDGKVVGEVVLKTGASISKDEMSREEKARKRRQNKAQHKASDKSSSGSQGKTAEKQQLVSDLKKGGVKVIDKEGKVTNMDGDKARPGHKNKGDTFKL